MSSPTLALVVPAYNEEECIRTVVSDWLSELEKTFPTADELRMIVVNDGSKDNTGKILDEIAATEKRLVVVHQPNGGHGNALMNGYRKAVELNAEFIFQTDSDDQFFADDFLKLWEKRNDSKFILGYRKLRHDAFVRLIITRFVRLILFFFYGVWIIDSNVPFRLINGAYLKKLVAQFDKVPFAPNIFLAVMAKRDKQNLFSIPVKHKERETGTVSILNWKLFKVCWKSTKELFAFRSKLKTALKQIHSK